MKRNPYTITFGREPAQSIPRLEESETILRDFTDEVPSQQVYIVTGVRGCGKTVFMTEIANTLKADLDWVVVEVNSQGDMQKTEEDVRQYLEEYVYDKIWSELSREDKRALYGIAVCPSGKVGDIREQIGMSTNTFSTYRNRLIKKGLVEKQERGYVTLILPAFDEYILENMEM